jgi:phage protein D
MDFDLSVFVGGSDFTDRFRDRVKSVSVRRSARKASDTASLSLADPGGALYLPPTGDTIVVSLGRRGDAGQVFEGFVDTVQSTGGKSSGRELSIKCNSIDNKSKVKEPALRSKDQAAFADVAVDWGGKIGLKVTVAGDLANIQRDYWMAQNESFMQWGSRMAAQLGASFKIIGSRAFFAPLNEGISATGKPLTAISGEYGVNLLDWSISPLIGRPRFRKVAAEHFSFEEAKWLRVEQQIAAIEGEASYRHLIGAASEGHASQKVNADAKETNRQKGGGSVTILGEWRAEPEAQFKLKGARSGVDSAYVIDSLEHVGAKGSGFTTKLELKLPADGAGQDQR